MGLQRQRWWAPRVACTLCNYQDNGPSAEPCLHFVCCVVCLQEAARCSGSTAAGMGGWTASTRTRTGGSTCRQRGRRASGWRAAYATSRCAPYQETYTRETECNLGPLCLHGEIPERPTPARAWQSLVGHLGHSAVTMGTTPRRAEAKGPSTPYHREQHHRHRCGRHQPSSPDAYIIMNNAHCSVAIILWGAKLVRRKPRHCGRRHHQRRRLYAESVRCARLACRRSTAVQLIAHLMRPRPVSAP